MEVVGELPDGADVRFLSALGEPGELEVVKHALTERRGHVEVLWQGVRESPLPGTLAYGGVACPGSMSRWKCR